jgi:hypothetical protein
MILERNAAVVDSFYHCYVDVIIMDRTRKTTKIFENKTEARSEVRSLKLRWLEDIESNLLKWKLF